MEDQLLIVGTPTKSAMYVKGLRVGPVAEGPANGVIAPPGANIKVVLVAEQDLPENLSDIEGLLDGPAVGID